MPLKHWKIYDIVKELFFRLFFFSKTVTLGTLKTLTNFAENLNLNVTFDSSIIYREELA